MTPDEFRAAVDAGKIKHMGLRESLMMVGNGLGVEFESVSDEKIEPIIAEREVKTQYLTVRAGPGGRRASDDLRQAAGSTSASSCACTSAPRMSRPTA